jgi:hypothetical protein
VTRSGVDAIESKSALADWLINGPAEKARAQPKNGPKAGPPLHYRKLKASIFALFCRAGKPLTSNTQGN